MRRTSTIAVAIVAGIAVALVVRSQRAARDREAALLDAIVSADPAARRSAWEEIPEGSDRAWRTRILDRVAAAAPEAMADAGRAFLDRDWLPEPAATRIALATASAEAGDPEPLLAWFEADWTGDPGALRRWSEGIAVVAGRDPPNTIEVTDRLLDRLFDSPTPAQLEAIEDWRSEEDALRSRRTDRAIDLALGLHGRVPRRIDDEATAMQAVLAGADPGDSTDLVPAWLLATRSDAGSRATLEARARTGDDAARLALAMKDANAVRRVNRSVLLDDEDSMDRRLIAAGRLATTGGLDATTTLALLETGPGGTDGSVHAAALLARRALDATERRDLRSRWFRSDDPIRRRAAILIAAIDAGESRGDGTLETIRTIADDPEATPSLRRTARLGLRAMDAWPADGPSPADYAARTARLEDGRIDPDAVMLGVLARDEMVIRRLSTPPDLPDEPFDDATNLRWGREIAWRVALVRELLPDWWRIAGEPVPGSVDSLRSWIDLLDACRRTEGRFATTDPPGEDVGP